MSKSVVMRFWDEVINERRLDLIEELMTPDYRQHAEGIAQGPDGVRAFLKSLFASSEGMRAKVTGLIEIDDLVITKTEIRFSRPAPGWEADNALVDVFRVRGERLAEHWDIAPYSS